MLVNTLAYFARTKVLRQSKVANAQTFGAPSIGADTTRFLAASRVVNNNMIGRPSIARGLPHALVGTPVGNAQTFGAPTIAKLAPGGGALALDGTATGQFSGSAVGSLALTTAKVDDIVVVCVGVEKSATAIQTVALIEDGVGLVWTRRAGVFEANEQNLEMWWAHAVAPLAADTITVTMNAPTDDGVLLAFAVNGSKNLAAPFAAAAPSTASGIGTSHPLTTITTTVPAALLIGISSSRSGAAYVAGEWPDGRDGVGYTHIANRENFGGARQCSIGAELKIVSAIQSGVDVDFVFPGNLDWLIVGDAIR